MAAFKENRFVCSGDFLDDCDNISDFLRIFGKYPHLFIHSVHTLDGTVNRLAALHGNLHGLAGKFAASSAFCAEAEIASSS